MTGRWANLALLVLLPLAALSGAGLFLVGSGPVWLVAGLHAGLGLAPLVLVPWKRVVVRRGLRRPRTGRTVAVVLTWAAVVAVATGVLHLVGVTAEALPLTVLQLHVAAGVVAGLLTVVHAVQRPVRARRTDAGRRALLRSGAVVAAAGGLGVAAAATGAATDRADRRRPTGSYRLTADAVPVTQWFLDTVPEVDPGTWRLELVTSAGSRRLSLADLSGADEVVATLDCTGGWWADLRWGGTRLRRLLPDADAAGSVLVTSWTGYARRLPLSDDLLLATSMEGAPLTTGHGAPVRLVVPGRRGYHWVKWVDRVEVVDGPWWVQPPLPLR